MQTPPNGLLVASFDTRQRYRNIVARLAQLNIPVQVWHDTGPVHGRGMRLIRSFFAREQPHTFIIVGAELPAFILAALSGIFWRSRLILQLGGDPIAVPRSLLHEQMRERRYLDAIRVYARILLARILLRHIDGCICASNELLLQVRQYTGRDLEAIVVPPVFRPAAIPRTNHNGPIRQLLTVTNLNYREKFEGVVSALEGIALFAAGRKQPVHYHIVGGGRFLEQLREYVQRQNWPNLIIHLAGFVDNVSKWYGEADVLVYFSTLDAWPNVLVEGQCHGLAIIANDYPPLREALGGHENGLFVALPDALALQHALDCLDTDPVLRQRIGEANLAKCSANAADTEQALKIVRFLFGPIENQIG
jgi:glycosyltransferase involved in cell wall biosynthesis